MKKKRAIPYGYTMKNGEITVDENEAEVIRQIFSDYCEGFTMSELANKLTQLSIPYCEKRVYWNKGVIARIIENEKYTGVNGFLPIIGIDEYKEAQVCKQERTKKKLIMNDSNIGVIRAKVLCTYCGERMVRRFEPRNKNPESWLCSNIECKKKVLISDELLELKIQEKLNLLIENPDLLEFKTIESESNGNLKDITELKRMCDTNNYSEDELLKKIIEMAEDRFQTLDDECYKFETKVKTAFSSAKTSETFDSELFLQTVKSVYLDPNGQLEIEFLNNFKI